MGECNLMICDLLVCDDKIWAVLGAISGLIASAAALVGVLVIPKQINALSKQEDIQNRTLKLTHYSEYTRRYQEILINLPSDIGSRHFKFSTLTKNDSEIVRRNLRAYFDLCYEEWDLHDRQVIDDASWQVWKEGMERTIRKPAFSEAWKVLSGLDSEFGPKFTKFIENLMI